MQSTDLIPYDEYAKMRDSFQRDSFEGEVWVPVLGLEDYYEVSNLCRFRASQDIMFSHGNRYGKAGDIKHCKGDIIKQMYGEYISVSLYDPNTKSVESKYSGIYSHLICSVSFAKEWDDKVTDHKDSNKHNNQLLNLQRISNKENCQKSYDKDEHNRWTNRKSAVMRSDGRYYSSIKAAVADGNGCDAALISAITTGGVCSGYKWRYADDAKQATVEQSRPNKRYDIMKRKTNRGYLVRCIETNEIDTGANMARKLHCVSDTIYRAIDYSGGYSKYLGLHFELAEECN